MMPAINGPTWRDIYDPAENLVHMNTRWVADLPERAGHFAHYEPYGRGSLEKKDFLESMNSENEFWINEAPDPIAAKMGNVLYPRNAPVKIKKRVHFDELGTEEENENEFKIDGADRTDRISWRTSTMLVKYAEKAVFAEDKEKFFDYGGWGREFVGDRQIAINILGRMEEIEEMMEKDSTYKLSLSDHSVKNYPKRFFRGALAKLREYMEVGPRMNWNAKEFVPSVATEEKVALVRTGPKKICGVYSVEKKPEKPNGAPSRKRPKGTGGNSTERLFWSMKSESDKKIEELNHKMDLLIQMGGPVVTAEKI